MKICGYCGNEYDEKEIKCPVCGSKLLKHTKGAETAADEYRRIEEEIKNKRKSRSMILGIGVGVIALIIFIAIFSVVNYLNDPQRDIDKEAEQLYEVAVRQIKDGDYDDAIETLDDINVSWSEYAKVEGKKIEAVKAQLTNKIEQYESAGDYESIITYINENVKDVNGDSDIEDIYNESVLKYKEDVIAIANTYVESKDYSAAMSVLTTASKIIGADADIEEKISDIGKQKILATVLVYKQNGEYASALRFINENIEIIGNNSEILIELSNCEEQFRNQILQEAEKLFLNNGYDSAINKINEGLSILKDDDILLRERELYGQMAPVALSEFNAYIGELYTGGAYSDDVEDNMGTTYSEAYYSYATDHSAVYDIGANYDILKGIVAVGKPMMSYETFTGSIRIYGDGQLIWEDNTINSSIKPYEMEVSISGITDLEIQIDSNGPGPVIFADVTLQKIKK